MTDANRFEPLAMNLKETRARWRKEPAFADAYDALGDEFATLASLIRARQAAKLTQAEVAARMGVAQAVIGRLESSAASRRHAPSLASLKRYAEALGCKLRIELVAEGPAKRRKVRAPASA